MNKIHVNSFDRLELIRRHFSAALPHLTLRKIINLLFNAIELHFRVASPKSLPPYIKIEPTPLCQLRCVSCVHKDFKFKQSLLKLNKGRMHLSLDDLKTIVEPIKDTLVGVSLSGYGEPMLNPNIGVLTEYLHGNNITVSFPTTMSMRLSAAQTKNLVNSGLDRIEISLDGTTEASYSQFRVGGDFNLVLRNVRSLADCRDALGSKRPEIVWKFIEFEHNKHETETIESLYRDLGFDRYVIHHDFCSESSMNIRRASGQSIVRQKKPCYWLWNTTVIRWDGSVLPCCSTWDTINLGNAIKDGIKTIWRSDAYKSLREGFDKNLYGRKMGEFCKACLDLEQDTSCGSDTRHPGGDPTERSISSGVFPDSSQFHARPDASYADVTGKSGLV